MTSRGKAAGQLASNGRIKGALGGAGNTTRGLTRSLDLTKEGLMPDRTRPCAIKGCNRKHEARGWCRLHYERWKRQGDPLALDHASPYDPLQKRIEQRIDRRPDGCWIWTGPKARAGYGSCRVPAVGDQPARERPAHRVVYELTKGPIPDGLILDHICYVPACVNPDHLRPVTYKQNAENWSHELRTDNTSGYRSVHWSTQRGKWMVRVQHNGRPHFGGYFTDVHEAGEAARALRIEMFTHNDIDRQGDA